MDAGAGDPVLRQVFPTPADGARVDDRDWGHILRYQIKVAFGFDRVFSNGDFLFPWSGFRDRENSAQLPPRCLDCRDLLGRPPLSPPLYFRLPVRPRQCEVLPFEMRRRRAVSVDDVHVEMAIDFDRTGNSINF